MLGCAVAVVDYVGHCRMSEYSFWGLSLHESTECIQAVGLEGTGKDATHGEQVIDEIIDSAFDGHFDDGVRDPTGQ